MCAVLGVAACGGGGSAFVDPTGPQEMLDLYTEGNRIAGELPNTVPTGSAELSGTFTGIIALAEATPGDSYVSSLSLSVDFAPATASLSGSTGQFYYYDTSGENGTVGVAVDGDLTLSASSLDYNGNIFTTNITGSLDNEDALTRTATGSVDTIFAGFADDVTHVTGVGTVLLEDGTVLDTALVAEDTTP